jgi:hypothetical protein
MPTAQRDIKQLIDQCVPERNEDDIKNTSCGHAVNQVAFLRPR